MRLIDQQYMDRPFYGVPKMTAHLRREGYAVGPKRIRRLMRLMGLVAVYQKPKTTTVNKEHRVYPYLLRNVTVSYPNQVWSADITYLPMSRGFMYLVAIIDWYSRYIVDWELSNTLDAQFCLDVLDRALEGGTPKINL